ncbi:hypothetical protein LVO79_02740 [Roseivivax marinus]|uniref:hypothetical protein n=1 Tax=Roseivivax marinus TaxID=1379903 RepID=UPI001F04E673|nr:hypothetical protein [Roseivivax marinus]UMA65399.1 hypothetical protein LVO79_02740 [Roseivivax marinus]
MSDIDKSNDKVRQKATHFIQNWNWYLSGLLAVLALFFYTFLPDIESKAQHGDFVAGFASALAFIWLIASFNQQKAELGLQRNELAMQRAAIEEQSKAMAVSAEYDLLSGCMLEIDNFQRELEKTPNTVNSINEISIALTDGVKYWKTILESTDPEVISEAYMKWTPIEISAHSFTKAYVSACNRYFDFKQLDVTASDDPIAYVIQNESSIRKIPQIGNYAGMAYVIANFLSTTEPGLKKISLAGSCALSLSSNNAMFETEYINGLIKYIKDRDGDFPKIYAKFRASEVSEKYEV